MLSESEIKSCEEHLRLAQGFLDTAVIGLAGSEFEIRNALSRAYYAAYHASRAWLITRGVPLKQSQDHGWLQKLIGRNRGAEFRRRIQEFCALREGADYLPQMLHSEGLGGDVDRFRALAEAKVIQAQIEVDWYAAEARKNLEVSRD